MGTDYVMKSRVKEKAKEAGMKVGADVYAALSQVVEFSIEEAIGNAKDDGR